MNQQEKIALSEQVAKLYGISSTQAFHDWGKGKWIYTYLACDSARCFELMVQYNLYPTVYISSSHIEWIDCGDGDGMAVGSCTSKLEATRIAILKALVKLKSE